MKHGPWPAHPKSRRRPSPPIRPHALALTPVSRETEARLDRYVALLLEWQAKTNLVAPSTLPHLWTRHISDSLQLLDLAPRPRSGSISAAAADFPAWCWPARWRRRRAQWSTWSSGSPRRRPSCARRSASPARAGTVHPADIGDTVERFAGAGRLRYGARAGSATSTHRLCGAAGETRRKGVVSQGARCRG